MIDDIPEDNGQAAYYEDTRPALPWNDSQGQQQYSAEHYDYLKGLYTSDYLAPLLKDIDDSHLSPRAKKTLKGTVRNFCSHTAFLSYQKDPEIAEIDLDIVLNQATISMTKIDINLPEYPSLIQNIRAHCSRFIFTRANGPERERILQNRMSMEQIQKIVESDEKQKRRRGLGILDALTGRSEE